MMAWMTVHPELVDAGRQVNSLSAAFSHSGRNRSAENLQPGIEHCRVNVPASKVRLRPIGGLHLSQHLSVAPPQLGDALKERTVVDTAFLKPRVIILPGDRLRAARAYFGKRLLPGIRSAAVGVLSNTDLPDGMQRR